MTAIDTADSAIHSVNAARGQSGTLQNRRTATIANLRIQVENTSSAASRIRNVDVAIEIASLTRNSILQQSGIANLGQANTQPQATPQSLQV